MRFGHRARAPPRRPCHPLSQFLGVRFPVMAVNYRTRTESVCFMPDGSEGSWGREHPQVGCSSSAHTSQLRRHLPVPHSLALSPCCPELCVLSLPYSWLCVTEIPLSLRAAQTLSTEAPSATPPPSLFLLCWSLSPRWFLSSAGAELPKLPLASTESPFLEFPRSQGKARLGHVLPLVAWVTIGEQDRLGKPEHLPPPAKERGSCSQKHGGGRAKQIIPANICRDLLCSVLDPVLSFHVFTQRSQPPS